MKYQLVFRQKASAHLVEIHEYYENQKQGLGDEFFLSVDATLNALKRNPLIFQLKFKKIRCATLSRFPYGIYYSQEASRIVVLSIIHFKRNPKLLRKL